MRNQDYRFYPHLSWRQDKIWKQFLSVEVKYKHEHTLIQQFRIHIRSDYVTRWKKQTSKRRGKKFATISHFDGTWISGIVYISKNSQKESKNFGYPECFGIECLHWNKFNCSSTHNMYRKQEGKWKITHRYTRPESARTNNEFKNSKSKSMWMCS